jgi:transcriptional regulator GlxA family with amidase domain
VAPRPVAFLIYPDLQVLDLTGPLEVFALANRLSEQDLYRTEVVAATAGPTPASCGLDVVAHRSVRTATGPYDTVVVAGGLGTAEAARDSRLINWLCRTAPTTRRMTAVCSGAFLLAQAGLLDGRRATTHWSACDTLERLFPTVRVEPDPIFVRDGDVWTSAGVTAGMDLALALVEDDHGRALALEVARWLVLFVRRPGGQSQFSAPLAGQAVEREPIRELQSFVISHPDADLSVAALAERAAMSTRTFARVFRNEVGTTPAAYVEAVRVEAARRLLETTDRGLVDIARACGFGTVETMHRVFRRVVKTTPGQYRSHFAA